MEADIRFTPPRGQGLDGLYDWLLGQHIDVTRASFLTDTLWFFYWYFLWPSAGDGLPVGIEAIPAGDTAAIVIHVPDSQAGAGTPGVPEEDISRLEEGFEREVRATVDDDFHVRITFRSIDEIARRFPVTQVSARGGHRDELPARPLLRYSAI